MGQDSQSAAGVGDGPWSGGSGKAPVGLLGGPAGLSQVERRGKVSLDVEPARGGETPDAVSLGVLGGQVWREPDGKKASRWAAYGACTSVLRRDTTQRARKHGCLLSHGRPALRLLQTCVSAGRQPGWLGRMPQGGGGGWGGCPEWPRPFKGKGSPLLSSPPA